MKQGTIVIVFEKKGRGYWKSVTLATVRDSADGQVTLFDGRIFRLHKGQWTNHDQRYATTMRPPFAWETYASFCSMRGLAQ